MDGRTLVSGSDDRTVRVWDLETQQQRTTLYGHTGRVIDVAFAPDGRSVASAGADGKIHVWLSASAREGDDEVEDQLDTIRWRTDPEGGFAITNAAIERHPDDSRPHAARGDGLALLKRSTEAVAAYTRAIELGDDSVETLYKRAIAHSDAGDWVGLEADAGRLIEKTQPIEKAESAEADLFLLRAHARARAADLAGAYEDASALLALDRTRCGCSRFSKPWRSRGSSRQRNESRARTPSRGLCGKTTLASSLPRTDRRRRSNGATRRPTRALTGSRSTSMTRAGRSARARFRTERS